jgi:hypothetical protein
MAPAQEPFISSWLTSPRCRIFSAEFICERANFALVPEQTSVASERITFFSPGCVPKFDSTPQIATTIWRSTP